MLGITLDPPTRAHLKNVYACVASMSLAAVWGAAVHMNGTWEGGLASFIGTIVMLVMLDATRHSRQENAGTRFLLLNGFGFFTGMSMGPLIEAVCEIDEAIVLSAIMYSFVIFSCFSLSAIMAPDDRYLELGGPLFAVTMILLLHALFNLSAKVTYEYLLICLLLWCGYILYDTQLIMERFRQGDQDYIFHAILVFWDLASLFEVILVLLADKENNKRRNRGRGRR